MGAALGFLTGAALNAANGYAQQKVQQKAQSDLAWHEFLNNSIQTNPEIADTEQGQKEIKRMYGEHADMVTTALKLKAQAKQQMQTDLGAAMGSGAPGPGGTPAGSPGMMMPQQGQVAKAGMSVGASQPSAPTDEYGPHIAQLDSEIQRMRGIQTKYAAESAFAPYASTIEKHIDELQKQRDSLTQEKFQSQQKTEDRAQRQQMHEDTEADRAATRAMQAQNHADSIALQKQGHEFMQQMAVEKNDEQKKIHFDNAQKNLSSQTESIAKMLSGASPADQATVKSLLDARNAQARRLKAQAEASGMDYDPEEFKPLTIKQVPGWFKEHIGIGPSTPTVAPDDKAVAAQPPPDATAIIKDKSGNVTGYRMKDGSIKRLSAG